MKNNGNFSLEQRIRNIVRDEIARSFGASSTDEYQEGEDVGAGEAAEEGETIRLAPINKGRSNRGRNGKGRVTNAKDRRLKRNREATA